jgi:hypothetical protein
LLTPVAGPVAAGGAVPVEAHAATGGQDIWIALACLVGILIAAYAFALAIYRRKIS